jgi:hypothetical protein
MKRISIALALLLCPPALAGNEGPHGGDGVYCEANPALNKLQGYYMLDFALMRKGMVQGRFEIHPELWAMSDPQAILAWIEGRLETLWPRLAHELHAFRANAFADGWIPVDNLDRIQDEGLWHRPDQSAVELIFPSMGLPWNCGGRADHPGQPFMEIEEVVRRAPQPGGGRIYYYEKSRLDELARNRALQVSFLLTHEWLRDYTQEPEALRRINRMLHSEVMLEWGRPRFRSAMAAMGFPALTAQ